MQHDMFRIGDILCVCHVLVVRFSLIGLTEKRRSLFLDSSNHDVLVIMGFLLVTIV